MTYIKESFHASLTLAEGEKMALQALKNVMEETITKENVELAVVTTRSKKLELRSVDSVQEILQGLS